jgi:hypothetical protein
MKKKYREPSFSLNDFKKWMENQNTEEKTNDIVGMSVESKISMKKLLEKIEPESGDLYEVAKDFRRQGGRVAEMDGSSLLIEVNSGSFIISRLFVRRVY